MSSPPPPAEPADAGTAVERPRRNEYGQPLGAPVAGWTPRALPAAVDLRGTSVRLESLAPEHLEGVHAATCAPGSEPDWTYLKVERPVTVAELASYVGTLWDSPVMHPVVFRDAVTGRVLGMAAYERIDPVAGSIEVGGIHFGPDLRRTRGATEAMTLMAGHAIDTLGYRRYEWKCDALHARSRAAATRLGFTFEGIFRQALVTKGRNRDTAWYAMTDTDWQVLAPVHELWLEQTAGGRPQRFPLGELTAAALARCADPPVPDGG